MILNNSSVNESDLWGVSTPADSDCEILLAVEKDAWGMRIRLSKQDAIDLANTLIHYAQNLEYNENHSDI